MAVDVLMPVAVLKFDHVEYTQKAGRSDLTGGHFNVCFSRLQNRIDRGEY